MTDATHEGQDISRLSPEARRALLARLLGRKAEESGTFPLSFAQERMWLLEQLNPGNTGLNIPTTARITGALHVTALSGALDELVRRHEVLRTSFRVEGDGPVQVVAPVGQIPLPLVDLSDVADPAAREARAERLVGEESVRPFDLRRAPLMRAVLIRLSETEHIFHVTLHHSVCDGWSIAVMLQDLGTLYRAAVAGTSPALPPLPVTYGAYARRQREALRGEVLTRQLDYWREQLAGCPTLLELPADRPRPAVQTFRSGHAEQRLPASMTAAIRTLSQREGVTPFMVLLSAFTVLLARLSGREDVPVGTPIAGRNHTDLSGLMGVFINMLVLRTDLSGSPTFRELMQRVRGVALNAFANQDVPFEKLLEELHPQRDLGHTPFFQALFNMLSFGQREIELPGAKATFTSPPEIGTNFDLTLYCIDYDGRYGLLLAYNADLFDDVRMVELLAQYRGLLEQILERPELPVAELTLVTAGAAGVLPDPRAALDAGWTISPQEGFARQARRYPARPAVQDGVGTLTYGELEAASNRLARALRAGGIGREDVVAVYAHRSAALVPALLGVLKAGAAFTILDPAYPEARLIEQVRLARPRAWLQLAAAGPLPEELEAAAGALAPAVRLDVPRRLDGAGGPWLAELPATDPAVPAGPDDLAYVAFTSGTSGRPKAVLGTLGPLAHFLRWHVETFGLEGAGRFAMLSGLAHDPLLRDILAPLWAGATLCIPDQNEILAPGRLLAWLRAQEVGVVHLTPALGRVLTAPAADEALAPAPALRYAFFGGDTLRGADVARLRAVAPAVTCVNFYGATETPQAMPLPSGASPAVQLLVLTAAGRLAGVGEAGEIYVRTPHLARGYGDDPVATAERFLPNPLGDVPGDTVYRSGDRGRYLPDGSVAFAGRDDRQVNVRGYRVEPAEIEGVLRRLPDVRDAAVVLRQDGAAEPSLVAYVVPRRAQPPAAGVLRNALRQALPDYMVPAAYVALPELPLTPNGKLDRAALPAPAGRPQAGDRPFVAPRTATEAVLAELWAEVLGAPRVGAEDDFFLLGGHSLLATQLLARVRAALGVELPLRRLFEAPTVAGLAPHVDAARLRAAGSAPPAIVPISRDGELPLTFSQERMWFIHQLQPESAAYNVGGGMRLSGALDLGALRRSLADVVRRHESLRTTLVMAGDHPVQVIRPAAAGDAGDAVLGDDLPLIDLDGIDSGVQEAELQRLADGFVRRPFDLARGPLWRAVLFRLGETEHVLVGAMHHAISDAWSVGIFTHDLALTYEATVAGVVPDLPALPVQYADFADWQRRWLQGEVLEEQLAYWRRRLAGAPDLALPTDRPRPAVQTYRGARESLALDTALFERLRAFGREEHATLFMTLLAGFFALLSRYSGQTDLTVGMPVANRRWLDSEHLIGTFVNTLVLRADLEDGPSFRELLRRVQRETLEAYDHQDLPFEKLVTELQPRREMSRAPLFQVMFDFINTPLPELRFPRLTWSQFEVDRGAAQFDLTLGVIDLPDVQRLSVEYNADLFDAPTIRRLLGHFRTLLEAAVADPARAVTALPLLPPAERRTLLTDWNDTAAAYPAGRCIHELIEAQARLTPQDVAVELEDRRLTYGELNARANGLARRLRDLGVAPGTIVGLCLERSVEMVIGLLAVLKAGGAYLPLDPSYPPERLAFMLQDSAAPIVLTQPHLLPDVPASPVRLVALDGGEAAPTGEAAADLSAAAGPEDLAYVIYTSGSTGKPKGVQIPHRAAVNFLTSMRQRPGLTARDTVLAVTTLSFDIAVLELLLPLTAGARVVIASRDVASDGVRLRAAVDAAGTTVLQATPVTWRLLLSAGWTGGPGLKALCGGEALPRDLAQHLLAQGVELWNMYGPTETTVWSTVHRVETADGPIPVGRPIANTEVYLLDAQRAPVPVGVPGELYIGGDGLARGYLNRPELTAERFVPHPFDARAGARLYRTGDLARYLPDGTIDVLGRIDHQVKLRGFRIELGEIESVLSLHPAVRETAVIVREDNPGDKRLVAYLVADEAPPAAALRAFLKQQLPDYMVPAAYVALPELPRTPNGKLDRAALPAPAGRPQAGDRPFVAPRTATEAVLAELWAEVLGAPRVGAEDDFFLLGGHSLLATQLLARVRAALGVELPLRRLFEAPTVEAMALAVAAEQARQLESDELSELLAEIESLSDDEARARIESAGS